MGASLTREAYQHMKRPHGVEPLPDAQLRGGCSQEGQGPFFIVYLQLEGERIRAAAFRSLACPWANAVGSALTILVEGKSLEEAVAVGPAEIIAELGGVPRDKRHYPAFAAQALKNTLGRSCGVLAGNR